MYDIVCIYIQDTKMPKYTHTISMHFLKTK